jgi:anti-sigma regulatory factor (Ser/Thr protein kinase)
MPAELALSLSRHPSAARVARQALRKRFGEALGPSRTQQLSLVVSELVSNAVLYGKGEVQLRVVADGDGIRGEVVDQGGGFERQVRREGADAVGGRGLLIVEALSARWGIHEGTTHVWFELAPAPAPARAADPQLGEDERPRGLDGPASPA